MDRPKSWDQSGLNLLKRWRYDLLALLFFALISFVLLWPLSGHLAVSTTNEGDALQQIWSMAWNSHALATDPANLFNGNIFYPYPDTIAYSDHLLAQTFQALPVFWLTGNYVLGYGLLTYLSFVLSGWGAYLLAKEISGSRAGGLFAGMVFAFASYKIGHLSQLNLLSTQWIPFCLLFLRRMLLRSRSDPFRQEIRHGWGTAAAFGLFFVLNGLSTFYYLFYLLPVLALYLVIYFGYERRWPGLAFVAQLVAVGIAAALVIVPTMLPYVSVVADQGAERTPRDVEQFSANYRFFLGTTPNNLLWGSSLSRLAGSGGERALFPGALAYLLGIIALLGPLVMWLVRKFRPKTVVAAPASNPTGPVLRLIPNERRERWAWTLIGLFAVLMSLGWTYHLRGWDVPGLYRLFYNYFPGWVALRAAVRYSVFGLLALAVLGGLAVAWLSRVDYVGLRRELKLGQTALPLRRVLGFGLAALLLAGAFFEYRYDISYTNPNVLPNPPEIYRWLAQPANAGPYIDLPAVADPVNPPSIRSYYSTFNWQPYLNGVSGYVPPVEQDIATLSNEFPSDRSLAVFQGMGVRWLVYHLDDENSPLSAADWQKTEQKLGQTPQVNPAKDFPNDKIKVYELAPDPWMRQLYAGLPAGSGVVVSDYRRTQPTLVELVATFLRRDGFSIYGADRAGYRFLKAPPAGPPVAAGLFAADEDPSGYGFGQNDLAWSGHGLKFYRRKDPLVAGYDLDRDPNLGRYKAIDGTLEISVEKDRLKFDGNDAGSGLNLNGLGQVDLLLSSFGLQTIKLNGQDYVLQGGVSRWRSPALSPGAKLTVTSEPGRTLYLNRAELVSSVASPPATPPTALPGATLLTAHTGFDGHEFKTEFQAWTPPVTAESPGSYVLTLDIYRRPWGTHPSGHFGTFSIALPGTNTPRPVVFTFDPLEKKMFATLDGKNVDVGAEVLKAAGNGDWAAFVTLRRSNPANSQDFPLVGQARLFEFSLDANKFTFTNPLPDQQMVLLPPLK